MVHRALLLLQLVGLALLSNHAQAADAHQTLKDVMQKAVLSSPEVLSKWHAFKAADGETDVARGALLPKLDITTGIGRETLKQPGTAVLDYRRNSQTITLNQMVYDGFTAIGDVKRLGKTKLTRYFELLEAAETVAQEAGRAYFDVMRFRYMYKLVEQNYVEHRAVYEQLLRRSQSGAGRRVDVEHAESRLALAEINLTTEQANLHDVTARYMRIINEVPAPIMFGPGRMASGFPVSAKAALEQAFKQNPTLRGAIENAEAAQYDLEARRGAFHPRLDLRVRSDNTNNYQGAPGNRRQDVAELVLNFNVFNGGSDIARERQYAERRNLALDLREKACRDIRQTLVIAYNDVLRLRAQLGFLGIQVAATEKTRAAYRDQFNIGQRSLLDVLDTENELLTARRTEINAEMDLGIAYLRTQSGIGSLLTAFGLKQPEEGIPDESEFSTVTPSELCGAQLPTIIEINNNALTARALRVLDSMKAGAKVTPGGPGDGLPVPVTELTPGTGVQAPAIAPPVGPVATTSDPALNQTDSSPTAAVEKTLRDRLAAWVAAWSGRDVAAYLAFYRADFLPESGASREAWAKQRASRIARANEIQVDVRDVRFAISGDKATADFVQGYVSDSYRDTTSKNLEWVNEGGQWGIQREVSAPLKDAEAPKRQGGWQ